MKKSIFTWLLCFSACLFMMLLNIPQNVVAAEPVTVDEIKYKVDIPIVDQKAGRPEYAIKGETEGFSCTDYLYGINDSSTAWFVKNGSEWQYFPEGSTFENGKEYGIRIAVAYNEADYKLSDTAKAYVNGNPSDLKFLQALSDHGYLIFYSFGVLDKDKVYNLTVDGGYAKNYISGSTVTTAKAGEKIELVAQAPDANHGIWYWDGDGVPSTAAAEAVTNHFTFVMPAHDVDVKAVWGALIKSAGCTITAPLAGKEVDKAPVSLEPDKYSVSYYNLFGTSDSGKLITDNHYEYVVEFTPKPGYVLDIYCDYSINDYSVFGNGVAYYTDNSHRFSVYEKFAFDAHDDSATEINKIVINGITPPVVGEPITTPSLTPGTEGYKIVDTYWQGYAITSSYFGYSTGEWLGEKFNNNTLYSLYVVVQPKEGYYFNRFITDISADKTCEVEYAKFISSYNQYVIHFQFNDLAKTYNIVSGNGSTWEMGSSDGISFILNGKYSDFLAAKIDRNGDSKYEFFKAAATGDDSATTFILGNDTNKMPSDITIGEHSITFIFSDGSVTGKFRIVPKAHSHKEELTPVTSKEATCTVDGNVAYYVCSCGAWFEDSEATKEITNHEAVIIKAAHTWDSEYTVDKEATCTEEGSKSIHCSKCTEKKDVTSIEKKAHVDGNKDGKCDACGDDMSGGLGGDPDPKPGPGGDPDPKPGPGGDPDPKPGPGGDPNPKPGPGGDPDPKPGPGGDPNPTPGPDGDPAPTPEADYLDELRDLLNAANAGDIVKWNKGTALPLDIMKLIVKKDVTLEFSYTYQNQAYVVVIDKDNVPTEEVPWYGPLYLASLTKTSKAANEYVVKPGDTLNIIARKLNTTVEELLKKNPSIKNPNVIFAGKTLKY